MAQNIGLVITLGGVEKVISSIEELEGAINSAREQLRKTTVPGSEEFKKLANDIRIADSRLKDLKKSSEGLEFEQKLEGFAKLGGSITAGFAAATAAVNLFGGDTERVSQAAAQAQNVLTIALTARSVAEGVAGLRTVALTVKTLAQTAATTAATAATRAFYATLVANPLGAVLAVIGLVVTALVALTNTTEEAESAEDKYQKTLKKTNDEREFTLALLREQGASETEQIQKRIGYAQQDLNAARARLNVLIQERASQKEINKELEIIAKSKETITLEQQRLDRITRENLEKGEKELADNRKKRADERKTQLEAEIALQGELTRAEIARNLAGRETDPVEFNNELQKRLDLVKKLVEGYQSEETALEKYNNTLGDVYDLRKLDYDEQKKLETQLLLLGKATGLYNSGLDVTVDLQERVLSSKDRLGNIVETSTIDNIVILGKGINGATQTFVEFDDRLTGVYNTLKLIQSGFASAGTDLSQLDLTNVVRVLQGFEEGDTILIERVVENRNLLAKFQEQFVADYVKNNLKVSKSEETYAKALEESTKSGQAAFALVLQNTENFVKFERATFGAASGLTQLVDEIEKLTNSGPALNAFLAQNRDLITQSFSVDLSKLGENRNALLALDRILATKQYSEAEGFRTEILELEKQLAEQGIDISKASDEEKLKLLRFYLGKEVEATEEAEVKKRTEFQKTLSTIENYISQFQGLLNSVSQLVADYYSIQLQELELQNKAILDQVVGDTEVANEKRLEQQKIYEAQREELEKEAAKRGLQIQLAQAVANTAQAITRVFAQEGTLGFITAGLVAAANAIQIGLISQQLSAVSSYQRGGWIKGQGGLVVGPSHEQGGVKYAQGGVELEGGEAVINRMSTLRYAGLLNSVNMSQGGKPIVVNNSFDDSRLLEALAKQKSEPIRAYVLEGDITAKQNVTKRLEQLSQF
jgi:hypothetical protein